MANSVSLGVGLRPQHFDYFSNSHSNQLEWLEVISENYIDQRGHSFKLLRALSERYKISCHGVSLNIGNPNGLNHTYLQRLKKLYDELRPAMISDHLCLTGIAYNSHDLMALPYNSEVLERVVERIHYLQDFLNRPLGLENLSSYFSYRDDEMEEEDFFNELVKRTGCRILLDVNNVYVKSQNLLKSPHRFLSKIDMSAIQQVHLAGFVDTGEYLADTHSMPVYPQVWTLVDEFKKQIKDKPIFIEWDNDIPSFDTLYEEALKAKKILES